MVEKDRSNVGQLLFVADFDGHRTGISNQMMLAGVGFFGLLMFCLCSVCDVVLSDTRRMSKCVWDMQEKVFYDR